MKISSSNIGEMKRDDAWKMLEGNPEYTKSHMNISYFFIKRLSGFYYGLASLFQNVPDCKREHGVDQQGNEE